MPDKTTNYGLTKPHGNEFYDIGVFNENADLIDSALSTKADDDFTHIPMVVCETAGDQKVKEITIPDYDEHKYPVVAIRFINTNTSDGVSICINGNNNGAGFPLYLGQGGSVNAVNSKYFPIRRGNVVLIQKPNTFDLYTVIGTSALATTARYGPTILAHNPRIEHPDDSQCAATPSYVKESVKAFNDFTHIPLVVCDTAGDQQVKEVTIPGYTKEKYPIIAVKFTNANTAIAIKLSINGDTAQLISAGSGPTQWVGPDTYMLSAGAVILLSKNGYDRWWCIIGAHSAATEENYGVVRLVHFPDIPGYSANRDATTPGFVNTLFERTLSNYEDKKTYPINTLVMQDGSIYKSLQDNNLNHPVTDPAWWAEYGGNDPEIEQIKNYTMLYDSGDECGEVTGGWRVSSNSGGTVTKNVGSVTTTAGNDAAHIVTTNKIPLEGFSTLAVLAQGITQSSNNCGYIAFTTNANPGVSDSGVVTLNITMTKEVSICNISSKESLYCRFGCQSNRACRMYAAALLKPDDPTRLLRTAGITTTYATPEALAADTSARSKILSSSKAVNALVKTCTGDVMYAILNNADWITAIKANDEAYRIIMGNPHWSKFVGIIPAAKELLGYTMLYDRGDECEGLKYGSFGGVHTLTKQFDKITVKKKDGSNGSVALYTQTPIDMRTYKAAMIDHDMEFTSGVATYPSSIRAYPQEPITGTSTNNIVLTPGNHAKITTGFNRKLDLNYFNSTDSRYVGISFDSGWSSDTHTEHCYMACILKSDPYTPWLTAANITKSFANLEAVFADTATLSILMSNRDAINYMISCTGTLMAGICNNEAAMTALVNSPVAYDAAFENAHWFKFMTMCPVSLAAMDSVAKKVPVMTSNTEPEGEASITTQYDENKPAFKAFDKSLSTATASIINTGMGWRLSYTFPSPIVPYKFTIKLSDGGVSSSDVVRVVEIQASNDGNDWYTLSTFTDKKPFSDATIINSCSASYRYFSVLFKQLTGSGAGYNYYASISEFNVYGKEVI